MYLETKRLILRSPQPQDVDAYMQFCNSDFVLRYNAMTPRSRERVLAQYSEPDDATLLLVTREQGSVIGQICIEEDSLRYGVASRELSYFMWEKYARQGYMKEALSAVIAYLFEKEDLVCVSARAFADNAASLALLASLGFTCNGRIPQCVKGYADVVHDDMLHTLLRGQFSK